MVGIKERKNAKKKEEEAARIMSSIYLKYIGKTI